MREKKIALVTGGNRGIGFHLVSQLCLKGITTIFTSTNPHDGMTALEKLGGAKKLADYHPLDISDKAAIADLRKFIEIKYGALDILINNAGTNYDSWQRASQVVMEEVEHTFSVNFFGPWALTTALLHLLLKSGDGRVINVSSGSGAFDSIDGTTPAYSLSKNALNMLSRSLAEDLQGSSVTVNSVCPGWTRTDMGGPDAPRAPEESAESIVWLATRRENSETGKFYRDKQVIPW